MTDHSLEKFLNVLIGIGAVGLLIFFIALLAGFVLAGVGIVKEGKK